MTGTDRSNSLSTDAVERVVADAPVTVAIIYGSHARGTATAGSDVDLAVVFESSLSSVERSRARLSLIERLSAVLETDAVDVVPLSRAPPELRRAVREDGIALVGSLEDIDVDDGSDQPSHEDRVEAFDELLADIENVV